MNDEWVDALSALSDGEYVDPDLVGAALESPQLRQLLVDCVKLRFAARQERSHPSPAFYERMNRALHGRQPPAYRGRVSFPVAAALLSEILLAGLGVEGWRHWREGRPPRPDRVLHFDASEWTTLEGRAS